ncbi:hypothetical protein PUN28_018279 [Cardiocondyla obscurior]|uniref:Uncharacterized protein n=1 Tax=Cardiocondyla obscurior TaxID=286306 RepID=A0AAW2EI74_9HYME
MPANVTLLPVEETTATRRQARLCSRGAGRPNLQQMHHQRRRRRDAMHRRRGEKERVRKRQGETEREREKNERKSLENGSAVTEKQKRERKHDIFVWWRLGVAQAPSGR